MTDINLCSPKYIRELMDSFGIAPQKRYGQNYLINPSIPERIAESAVDGFPSPCVLEIGPGIGSLTRELAVRSERVVSVEIDDDLIPVLAETTGDLDNVSIVHGDIMNVDIGALTEESFGGRDFIVAANLPYYITTPIIMKLLETSLTRLRSVTVMIQTEVAARLTASAGTADYGAITAAVSYYGQARRLFQVSPGSFLPAPKVTSTVVKIDIYPRELRPVVPVDEKLMFRVIAAAFAQRRKTLPNALASGIPGLDKQTAESIVTSAGFDPRIRGEALTVSDFAAIADAISSVIT